ncbi:MAG: MerR family transcriptional regulator [Actinomycetaceae bacterium]|nr:MerR family transcriptional regulator [Actinomycetaceae bacterium]
MSGMSGTQQGQSLRAVASDLIGPLTVAAVASRLGVAASTLRTWDRRYGLGPSFRTLGSHRRYSPLDVARLESMRALMRSGVTPGDAAAIVLRQTEAQNRVSGKQPVADAENLVKAARAGDRVFLRSAVENLITNKGLLGAWNDVLEHVLDQLMHFPGEQQPGFDPGSVFSQAILDSIEQMQVPEALNADPVLLVASRDQAVLAHIMAATLASNRIKTKVLLVLRGHLRETWESLTCLERESGGVMVVLDPEVASSEMIQDLMHCPGFSILLVGPDTPVVQSPQVERIRSLSAAVAEVADLLGSAARY